ncbi:RNA-splicing ligase RtcB [Pseudodesulfovibrio sp. F-1]|uniref:tRNA-splicing ligase RtcB n=1 Tax=Pseudodesulfovibrio alkaliphilus TaxID=2661613 RepID=A0A7K1KQI7_9BACT|nr:RtcB family protein [Pseudodesulfovibrio alkaliphilus]MUM78347.1 RNA-splicing ligase RtcB [Pseudodesulfovibrio alkaliphilus]
MTLHGLARHGEFEWHLPMTSGMRVPAIVFGSLELVRAMDDKTLTQLRNVACLPGIVRAAMAMPDAHSGYGFPIGGVAAFDPAHGGVVSMGGVGFDISCGVRTLLTGLTRDHILARREELADALFRAVPSGVGRGGTIILEGEDLAAMLEGGAVWAVGRGYGQPADLGRIEDGGRMPGAVPGHVSPHAGKRIRDQLGSLGSGNHYLEVQWVEKILDPARSAAFALKEGDVVVSIHCGSRGLGHQIGQDFIDELAPGGKARRKGKNAAPNPYLPVPDREMVCAPIDSEPGRRYLGAMRSGINCALANRQVITHLVREVFADIFPTARLDLLYDVSHNTCRAESHRVDGKEKTLFVHRKGATRALGPGHPDLPAALRGAGQPVLVGGSMGTASYILAGTTEGEARSFSSACHGAGRVLSRTEARRRFVGRDLMESLRHQGVFVRTMSSRGIAEEAPGAYKDIDEVTSSAAGAGLAAPVARTLPLVCVKG